MVINDRLKGSYYRAPMTKLANRRELVNAINELIDYFNTLSAQLKECFDKITINRALMLTKLAKIRSEIQHFKYIVNNLPYEIDQHIAEKLKQTIAAFDSSVNTFVVNYSDNMFDHNGSLDSVATVDKQTLIDEWDKSINSIPTSLGIKWYSGKLSSSDVMSNLRNVIHVMKLNNYEGNNKEDYINSNLILELFVYSDKGMIWISLGKDGFYGYNFSIKYQSPNFNYNIKLGSESYNIYKDYDLNRIDIDFVIDNIVADVGSDVFIKFCTNMPANNESGKSLFVLNGTPTFGVFETLRTVADFTNGALYRDDKDCAYYQQENKFIKDITLSSLYHVNTSNVINYKDIIKKDIQTDSKVKEYYTNFKSIATTKSTEYKLSNYNLANKIMDLRENLSGIVIDNTSEEIKGRYIDSNEFENNAFNDSPRYMDGQINVNLIDHKILNDVSLIKGSSEMMSFENFANCSNKIKHNGDGTDEHIKTNIINDVIDTNNMQTYDLKNPIKNIKFADTTEGIGTQDGYNNIYTDQNEDPENTFYSGYGLGKVEFITFENKYKIYYDIAANCISIYDMTNNYIHRTSFAKKIISHCTSADGTLYLGTDSGILKVMHTASIPNIVATNIISGVFGTMIPFNNGMVYAFRTTEIPQFVERTQGIGEGRYYLKDYMYVLYTNSVWYEINDLCESILGVSETEFEQYSYSKEEAEQIHTLHRINDNGGIIEPEMDFSITMKDVVNVMYKTLNVHKISETSALVTGKAFSLRSGKNTNVVCRSIFKLESLNVKGVTLPLLKLQWNQDRYTIFYNIMNNLANSYLKVGNFVENDTVDYKIVPQYVNYIRNNNLLLISPIGYGLPFIYNFETDSLEYLNDKFLETPSKRKIKIRQIVQTVAEKLDTTIDINANSINLPNVTDVNKYANTYYYELANIQSGSGYDNYDYYKLKNGDFIRTKLSYSLTNRDAYMYHWFNPRLLCDNKLLLDGVGRSSPRLKFILLDYDTLTRHDVESFGVGDYNYEMKHSQYYIADNELILGFRDKRRAGTTRYLEELLYYSATLDASKYSMDRRLSFSTSILNK